MAEVKYKKVVRLISRFNNPKSSEDGMICKVREFELSVKADGCLGKEATDLFQEAWEDMMEGLDVTAEFG